jgi:hypothetical protein
MLAAFVSLITSRKAHDGMFGELRPQTLVFSRPRYNKLNEATLVRATIATMAAYAAAAAT